MEKATSKEVKQVKEILKNIAKYAKVNDLEFSVRKFDGMNLFPDEPKDLVNYCLYDNGFILSFNISFKRKIAYIEEFSEDSDIKQEISFKEFIKFQEHFLDSGVKTTNSLSLKPIHIKRCKKLIALNNLIRTEDETLDNITLSFMDVENDDMMHYKFNISNDCAFIEVSDNSGKFFLYDIKREDMIVGGLK